MTDPERVRREVIAHYRAGVKAALLLEYRCHANGCLLLHVWATPNGPEYLMPGHRLSERFMPLRRFERFAFDNAGDEGDLWGGRLGEHPSTSWVQLACDHVRETVPMSTITADLADQPGRPRPILWPRDTPRHI